jgi:hypothetical protein
MAKTTYTPPKWFIDGMAMSEEIIERHKALGYFTPDYLWFRWHIETDKSSRVNYSYNKDKKLIEEVDMPEAIRDILKKPIKAKY